MKLSCLQSLSRSSQQCRIMFRLEGTYEEAVPKRFFRFYSDDLFFWLLDITSILAVCFAWELPYSKFVLLASPWCPFYFLILSFHFPYLLLTVDHLVNSSPLLLFLQSWTWHDIGQSSLSTHCPYNSPALYLYTSGFSRGTICWLLVIHQNIVL